MTNTNFIKDLELVEGALNELKHISKLEVNTTNICTLIHERLKASLPEVTFTLVMQDVLNADKDGLTFLPEDIENVLQRKVTVEEILQKKRALQSH